MGFSNKNLDFFIIAKGGKFAVKCDGFSKLPHKVRNLVFYKKKINVFRRNNMTLLKALKLKNLPYVPIEKKTTQNVQNLGFLSKN